eukprot:TRINITY_DN684_c0_g1_i2.p3 TRINITY_DN684_c0_g1~~TRINITY_DN684_c0_g1_i2.p3  ORF type:complete len:58 (+),score=13.35 TRINITY_DN684_c0_g1_i2:344-517(+)
MMSVENMMTSPPSPLNMGASTVFISLLQDTESEFECGDKAITTTYCTDNEGEGLTSF